MNLCTICKGSRKLCGKDKCPILTRIYYQKISEPKLKETIFGPSPKSVFIGYEGYPEVFAGPLIALSNLNLERIDTPEKMFGQGIENIMNDRYSLVRGKIRKDIFSSDRYISELQAVALSERPVDLEVSFRKKPKLNVSFSMITQPMGASGELNKMNVTENPKIKNSAYRFAAGDIKSVDAIKGLYTLGFEVSQISKILSSGALGIKRKLVPTRWSITAIDDTLGKYFISILKDNPKINEYQLFESSYLDNHYHILLLPGNWEFEQIETWFPNTLWNLTSKEPGVTSEYEGYEGRRDYAELQQGGYYAARFSVAEELVKLKRQARALVIREIFEGYEIPVGVWEVRETIRDAFRKPSKKFNSLSSLLAELKTRLSVQRYKIESKLLKQKRIIDYMQG